MKLLCFVFPVLCYLPGREVIIITPFMYKSIQFPKVSQRTFKTKGLISIESTFLGNPVDMGCLAFTQRFQYFRMENKWNTHFWSTQPGNYRNKRFALKGCPL